MFNPEKFYPIETNLGQNCQYWSLGGIATGCCYPKLELEGRRSCEGIIDDVCLYVKTGRNPSSLTSDQMIEIKSMIHHYNDKSYLPPGDIN